MSRLIHRRLLVIALALALGACSAPEEGSPEAKQDEREILYWVAPMDPNYRRDEPGKSPMGMDLTPVYAEEEKKEPEILYWVAPMDPNYRRDEPGKSPMGMDLVPVYADADAGDDAGGPSVKIAPEVVNMLGVRTALSERGRLWRRISTVGYVDYDESRIAHVHPRTDGWIERLDVQSVGERVKRGQRLFTLYSPALVNAQEEYVHILKGGNANLIRATEERLAALGVSPAQMRKLKKTRRVLQTIDVYASQDGVVDTLNVREGMYIVPGTEVMSLADLSSVWLLAEVFERQVDWVRVGQEAEVRLSYQPGREWSGMVHYIYPSLDPKTRTLKVRLRFDNPGEVLKPNMYADVNIYAGPKDDIVFIPREALIRGGESERVIIDRGEGRFAAREVRSGMESGDWVEIVEGVQEDERVVVSGQFLIDSEASLKASMMRMSEPAPAGEAVSGTGIIRALMPEEGKLKLEHDPVEALDWPAMTMDFELAPGVSIEGLAEGDHLRFELGAREEGYPITAIETMQH